MADFTLTPDFVFDETLKYRTLVSKFDNGVEQRRSKWANPLREFRLQFRNREQADYTTLVAFYKSKLGSFESFTFENPNDGQTYTVRFKEDSLRLTLKSYQIYDFECYLTEVNE